MRCGYIRWIWDCGNTREVEEKHTGRYGARGQKRQKRRKATPEEIAKQNQWKRERDVRRLIKWNFGIGDYWFTLTYKKGSRPPWKQMQKDMSKFIRKLRDNSEEYGLKVYLCNDHHIYGPEAVHNNARIRHEMQRMAQREFEKRYDHAKFMEVFGRNFLGPSGENDEEMVRTDRKRD